MRSRTRCDDGDAELRACRGRSACRSARAGALRPRRRRTQPLGGRGDPREPSPSSLVDLPALHQRLLDELAIGALEPVVRVHRAGDAVERRRRCDRSARAAAPSSPCSWTCSQSHSARRLLPTPASPMSATIRRACWLRGAAPQTASTICQQLRALLARARPSARDEAPSRPGRERLRGGDGAAQRGPRRSGRRRAPSARLATTSSSVGVVRGPERAQRGARRRANSKRCHGFFARSRCTNTPTPAAARPAGSSSARHGRALVRAEDLLRACPRRPPCPRGRGR